MMEIRRVSVNDCSRELYRKLYSLNYRERGEMRDELKYTKRHDLNGIIHYIEQDGEIVCWSLSFRCPQCHNKMATHIYTRKAYRNKGLGSKVLNAVKDYAAQNNETIVVHPYNIKSYLFFGRHMKDARAKVELDPYGTEEEISGWNANIR